MSERADTAYSPRAREEEHSAAASPLPPLQREHRVDGRGDADRSDENRSDGHCPARNTHWEEDGTDREKRCRVGDLPGHYRLRALGKRGKSLHTRTNRMYDGDERIDSNGEACRSNDARRNILVRAKVPAANKRGRERERNYAKEKPRDNGIHEKTPVTVILWRKLDRHRLHAERGERHGVRANLQPLRG